MCRLVSVTEVWVVGMGIPAAASGHSSWPRPWFRVPPTVSRDYTKVSQNAPKTGIVSWHDIWSSDNHLCDVQQYTFHSLGGDKERLRGFRRSWISRQLVFAPLRFSSSSQHSSDWRLRPLFSTSHAPCRSQPDSQRPHERTRVQPA